MDVHIGQRAQEEGRSITNYLERLITEDALRKTALPQQLRQLRNIRRNPPRPHCAGNAFSSPGKTARTKPSARLDPLRTSSELDRCSRSFFAALGLCTRHKKVPPLHPASTYPQDHPRPGPVRGS